jgi:hypothetical protein
MKFHPGKFEPNMRLLGSDAVLAELKAGRTGQQILDSARGQLDGFLAVRAKYLLYR